jgi:hypothetical protein
VRRLATEDVVRAAPAAWSLVLAVLMLGGALGPGHVLSYDMVWVPDLALGRDALGLGTALPRAVPSDAVVAVLDEVLGGVLLQKVVLLAPLVAAGAGAAALVGHDLVARLVAASLAVWNPFVVERLAIGHWPVLLGYGALPWVLLAATAWRRTGRLPVALPVLLMVGSLSASTGLVTGFAAVVAGAGRDVRRMLTLGSLVLVANLPWLVSGLLHVGNATSSVAGADVFAPGREGLLPAPVAFLTLGGIWNAEVVPDTRTGGMGVAFTAVVVVLALVGIGPARRSVPRHRLTALVVCWASGTTLVVLGWAFPDGAGWLANRVPGAGLLRDGSRLLALAAPLLAVLAGLGASALVRRLPDGVSRAVIAGSLCIIPVALMPDGARGLSGRLDAVAYPPSYEELTRTLSALPVGDATLLPFESYRVPDWNGGRPVLAPLGRYVPRRVVVNDELVVDRRRLPGEDPQAAEVREALSADDPAARTEALLAAGIRLVLVEDLGVPVPEVEGTVVPVDDGLRVVDLGEPPAARAVPPWWTAAMTVAWAMWCTLLVLSLAAWRRRPRKRR